MSVASRVAVVAVLVAAGVAGPGRRSVEAGDGPSPPPRVPLVDPEADELVDGLPVHWTVFEGAHRGDGPSSRVSVEAGSGLRLEGDASTRRWKGVSQRVEVKEGVIYRLSFEARATGIHREVDQYDNAYVGVTLFGPPTRNATTLKRVEPVGEGWTPEEIVFRAEGSRAELIAFLSKTGRLELRKPVLEELRVGDSIDVLVRHMTRYYAHFDPAIVDWTKLVAEHRPSFPSDADPAAFSAAAKDMLSALKDTHVWIKPTTGGALIAPYTPTITTNGNLVVLRAALPGARQVGHIALLGELGGDVGCLVLGALQGTDAEFAEIDRGLDAWRAAGRSVLIDLRWNVGGDERRALAIASRFADRERVYARRRVRSGPGLLDLSAPSDARLVPAKDANATTPVVVLIGPSCASSGEGMVQMFHVLPQVKLVGQPTRGASGNPQPVGLPNGVEVWFSRWMDYLPDGTPLEGRGVPPDVLVEHAGPGDPTFDRGLALLRELSHAK